MCIRDSYRRERARFSRDEGLSASEPVLSMPRTELLRGLASTMEESTETSVTNLSRSKPVDVVMPSMGDAFSHSEMSPRRGPPPPEAGLETKARLKQRVVWALETAKAVCALHQAGIAHLDLKTDNVLLHEDTALLTDFGCAMVLKEDSDHLELVCANTGTLAFMAPELIVSEEGRSAEVQLRCNPLAADSFSYGFLLFECVTFEREPRYRRFVTEDDKRMTSAPVLEEGEMDGDWGQVPREIEGLVADCWAHDPERRPHMTEIVSRLQAILEHLGSSSVNH
eukprot:TRINITY_DN6267_c0_g1_i1.p1 TRINITY_DN6267_c0_g1~~TRINITY_DN6267_c0_g1_i1.p1  ORF type:complete len:282 (-),score=52.95 TRINITY_DN6267_c0_g1_i1:155-1000(-)